MIFSALTYAFLFFCVIDLVMKKQLFYFALLFIFAGIITSCEWINPEEKTPAFIKIDSIGFQTQPTEGTANQYIADAWVFVNGEKIGAFELPATIPILKEGPVELTIYPGIKLNGQSGMRGVHPFFTYYTSDVNLVPDSTLNVSYKSAYASGITFSLIENFEGSGIVFDRSSSSDTMIYRTNDPDKVFEGNGAGIIYLDNDRKEADIRSINTFILPKSTGYSFLELNFKTTNTVTVGIVANRPSESYFDPIVVLKPSDTWKKIYINLTPTVARETTALNFNIYFAAKLDNDKAASYILLDNIKLVHTEN